MSAMPERVQAYITPDGDVVLVQPNGDHRGVVLVPESALLAVEARVRELEQIHRDEMDLHDEMEAKLAAEREALVPMARRFLKLMDWARAHYAPVGGTWPLIDPMDHFTLTDLMDTTEVKQARAILAREAGE